MFIVADTQFSRSITLWQCWYTWSHCLWCSMELTITLYKPKENI